MSIIHTRDALLALIQGEEGRSWASSRVGWSETSDEEYCQWDGVVCDPIDSEEVIAIHLPKSDLFGTLPTELGSLTFLRTIDLRQNLLVGTIPDRINGLPVLEQVLLADNRLEGPMLSFRSDGLQKLDVSGNLLFGSLPDGFLSGNTALTSLDLRQNKLTGTLPTGLASLTLLETLSLTDNRLSGTLPIYLWSLPQLKHMYLSGNNLLGTLPEEWTETSYIDGKLTEVWLHDNLISGSLPGSFGALPNLVDLFVDGNKLTGSVPESICSLKLNTEFSNMTGDSLEISSLICDAVACPTGTLSLEGVYPCQKCQSALASPYIGQAGACRNVTESMLISHLLSLSDKTVQNDIDNESLCNTSGIVCNSDARVTRIHLPNRGIRGTIPDELGLFEFLEELDLSDNKLTGFLPSGLRFAPLRKLDVSGNKIRGIVPPLLCDKSGMNGNGDDDQYSCDNIACPIGTFNSRGFGPCTPCTDGETSLFLASKSCLIVADGNDTATKRSIFSNVILSVVLVISFVIIGVAVKERSRRRRQQARMMTSPPQTQWENNDEDMAEHLPHVEELKTRLRSLRGESNQTMRRSWLSRRLERSMRLVINLNDGGSQLDPDAAAGEPDFPVLHYKDDVSVGSHLSRASSELERVVHEQARNVMVWDYPDPLEQVASVTEGEEFFDEELSTSSAGSSSHSDYQGVAIFWSKGE